MFFFYVLSPFNKAIDAVYFQGANKDGYYFVGATARRPNRVINGFVFLKVGHFAPHLKNVSLLRSIKCLTSEATEQKDYLSRIYYTPRC